MGATLDALSRLQEVELQIAELQRGIKKKQRAADRQEHRLAELDAAIRARQAAVRTDQMEADRLDLDVKSREVEIAKLRQALNMAKTNKEYSAILTQLNTTKADSSKLEERVLVLFNQLEIKRKELATVQEEREKELHKLTELNAALLETQDRSRDKLSRLTEARETVALDVPGKALDTFNRVAAKHEGEALARVVRTHPKRAEYACGGCNMSITIEQVNNILSRDDAVLCNNCGRILWYEASTAAQAR